MSGFQRSTAPEFGIFVVEVPRNSRRAFSDGQNFGGNFVSLPLSTPRFPGGSLSQLGVQVQLVDVDALVTGEGGVSRPGLEAQPALVLELLLLHVLTKVDGTLCKNREKLP